MSSGIDYSKWDRMDYGSSSSDDEEEGADAAGGEVGAAAPGTPRVTKLDRPCRVTRTADGNIQIDASGEEAGTRQRQPDSPPPAASDGAAEPAAATPNRPTTTTAAASCDAADPAAVPAAWTEKGSAETVQGLQLYWCQDRYTATLRLALPPEPGARWTCELSRQLPYADRHAASLTHGAPRSVLEVRRRPRTGEAVRSADTNRDDLLLLRAELTYPVHAAEDEDDDGGDLDGYSDGLDWSIETLEPHGRFLTVVLRKATPMPGVALWWSRPLAGLPEIAMDWRDNAASSNFQKTWDEAHTLFRDQQSRERREQERRAV